MPEAKTPDWAIQQIDLRNYMMWWIEKSTECWKNQPYGGGHDEGLFTRTWPGYYILTGDKNAYEFLDMLAHQFVDHPEVEACKCFLTPEDAATYPNQKRRPPYHGYPADQACLIHAPENYAWFLTHMCHINPSPRLLAALDDCAEHIGNWSKDVPDWYDWENHRFRSFIFGTKMVRDQPPYDFESLVTIRVLIIATNMYALTGRQRYLDVSVDYADHWAKIVLEAPDEGFQGMFAFVPDEELDAKYGYLADRIRGSRVRCSMELANLLLDLSRYVDKPDYIAAVRRMMEWSCEDTGYPGGENVLVSTLFGKYRTFTGDTNFDDKVVAAADKMIIEDDSRPALLLMNKASEQALNLAGLQYLRLYPDKRVAIDERHPWVLAQATQMTGDTKYLAHGMELAKWRFSDSHYIWDGRELGCRGSWQGRNGVALHNIVPTLYVSALGGFTMLFGEIPWLEVSYSHQDGAIGLPEGLAALFIPTNRNERKVIFYNTTEAPIPVVVKPENTKLTAKSATLDGQAAAGPSDAVLIPPGREVEYKIFLG
ncbi:MAG: hypothetical protein Q7N50_07660 [Armatimonadota bacterium]|nr:hypothetical protein [Armatimonadota bacterium]